MKTTRAQVSQREQKVDEATLERYLRSPEGLGAETRRAVEQHLRKDAAARARVISFLYFVDEVAGMSGPSA